MYTKPGEEIYRTQQLIHRVKSRTQQLIHRVKSDRCNYRTQKIALRGLSPLRAEKS